MRVLGCWLEAEIWDCKPEWENSQLFDYEKFIIPETNIILYLKKGIGVIETRGVSYSKITKEPIGGVLIMTDGTYCWTKSYQYYVSKGMLEIDSEFKNHIENNGFELPPKETIDLEEIRRFLNFKGFL